MYIHGLWSHLHHHGNYYFHTNEPHCHWINLADLAQLETGLVEAKNYFTRTQNGNIAAEVRAN